MGNNIKTMSHQEEATPPTSSIQKIKYLEPVKSFVFHEAFTEETNNGLCLNNLYFPEEIITIILSHVDSKELLKCSEVCKKWCNIIKSDTFWAKLYQRKCNKKPKKLPWYVYYCAVTTDYFDNNLIKNGNGQNNYEHWVIIHNYGDEFRIEDPPCGSDALPANVPEFNGNTSCFATSYYECNKLQEISFENNRLIQFILNKFKPHIYVSEWVAGRFDCGCIYHLWCKLYRRRDESVERVVKRRNSSSSEFDGVSSDEAENEVIYIEHKSYGVDQWAGSTWTKVELLVQDYPDDVARIVFQHEGKDTQFWKGHYGSKMAGGVLKILLDSIGEAEKNEN